MESIQIENFIDPEKLKEDARIDVTDLDNTMICHPSLAVYYAEQAVLAEHQYDRARQYLELLEASIYSRLKKEAGDKGKKMTETELKSAIVKTALYQKAYSDMVEAKKIFKLCDVARASFAQRKDLILEIARDRRKEAEGQLRVMERDSLRNSVLDQLRKSST